MNSPKIYLFTILVSITSIIQAQTVKVTHLQEIKTDTPAYYPILFDNGHKLLITNFNYKGLSMIDLHSGEESVLSTAEGAGYNIHISTDKSRIIFREYSIKNNRRFTAIQSVAIDGSSKQMLAPAQRTFNPRTLMTNDCFAISENLQIALYQNGEKTLLTPNGDDKQYIWPSVSPDGKKILYTVSGIGSFICDLNGKNPVSLGILRAPKWFNNQWVVGMNNATTNYVTTSSLIIAKIDGSYRQALTPPDITAMYPSVEGNQIAFNTDMGRLYIMDISIHE